MLRAPASRSLSVGGLILVLAGCSSSGTPIADAGKDVPSACKTPVNVYLQSTLGPSSCSTGVCPPACPIATTTNALMLGSVPSGLSSGTGGVTADCTVTKSGPGFDVSATVASPSGSFTVSGKTLPAGSASGFTATLDYGAGGPSVLYGGKACSLHLANASTPGYSPASGPPIAPGRIWGTVTCPDMTVSGQPGACEGTLLFRLENCRDPGCP